LKFVFEHATIIEPFPLKEFVFKDPDENKFLACALASGSKINGDKHLLKVRDTGELSDEAACFY
jgi:predicted nucleic acid-binding protein